MKILWFFTYDSHEIFLFYMMASCRLPIEYDLLEIQEIIQQYKKILYAFVLSIFYVNIAIKSSYINNEKLS